MFEKIFIKKSSNTFVQAFRYVFAGSAGFAVDFLILFILTHYFNLYYLLSAAIGFIAGVFLTYIISIYWVFQIKSHRSRVGEFIIFILIGLAGLGITVVFLWVFTEKTHINYLLSKILSTIIVYFWNFFARKRLLFKDGNIGIDLD